MAVSFGFFLDAALTQQVVGNLTYQLAEDGSSGLVTKQLWIGSNVDPGNRKIQDNAAPGASNLQVILADDTPGNAPGAPEVTDMALSLDNISWEADGDPLDLGVTEILSGVVNAFTFYARASVFAGATSGNFVELRLQMLGLREVSV